MEEDEISAQACKFPRLENGRSNPNSNKILGSTEENGEMVVRRGGGVVGVGGGEVVSSNRFHGWHHHSSRIIRVSRASGGKDRHSKVMTSKGLRDRRVRLSVTTAIQFYDLQDRLGYDQPSKAVEWLIKAASDAISELPSLSNTFPDTPKDHQPSDEKRVGSVEGTEHHHHQGFGDTNNNADEDYQNQTQSQNLSLSKSACSSNSETSKGSGGLSLSRSEIRVKARERARERAAKDKEKDNTTGGTTTTTHQHNPISQTASFTELLTGGINTSSTTGDDEHGHHHETNLFNKAARQQWCTTTAMDYFNSGLIVGNHSMRTHNNNHNNQASSGFSSGQIQLGNSCFPLQAALSVSPFNVVVGGENHQSSDHQLQNFSSMPDHSHHQHHQHHHHLMASGSSDYNLNFTISPSSSSAGLAGFNRGTLQSNSPSLLPTHPLHQRFSSSSLDGSNLPFFIGAAPPTTMENHHHHHQQQQQQQFSSGFDGRLQLCYGDLTRHSDHSKGKGGKN